MASLGLIGVLVSVIGLIWVAVIAFQNGDTAWGVMSLICGFVAIVYGIQNFEEAKIPLLMIVLGGVVKGVASMAHVSSH